MGFTSAGTTNNDFPDWYLKTNASFSRKQKTARGDKIERCSAAKGAASSGLVQSVQLIRATSYLFRDEPAHECHNISRQHATKTKRPAAHSCYCCLHAFLGKAQCTNTGHKFPNNQPTTSVAPPRNRPFALFVMTNHWSSNFHLIEAVSEGTKSDLCVKPRKERGGDEW